MRAFCGDADGGAAPLFVDDDDATKQTIDLLVYLATISCRTTEKPNNGVGSSRDVPLFFEIPRRMAGFVSAHVLGKSYSLRAIDLYSIPCLVLIISSFCLGY